MNSIELASLRNLPPGKLRTHPGVRALTDELARDNFEREVFPTAVEARIHAEGIREGLTDWRAVRGLSRSLDRRRGDTSTPVAARTFPVRK